MRNNEKIWRLKAKKKMLLFKKAINRKVKS